VNGFCLRVNRFYGKEWSRTREVRVERGRFVAEIFRRGEFLRKSPPLRRLAKML
jgi:hypothetical protein